MADDNKPDTALAEAMAKAEYQSEGGELSRRKPGRPPKTTAGVANTVDTYEPSKERNNLDQALQPTGEGHIAGDGDAPDGVPFGGKGDHDKDGKPGGSAVSEMFPVLLKKNYRPMTNNWRIVKTDGSLGPAPEFGADESPKAKAGFKIALPKDEAKDIIGKGIAERADAL